MNFGIFIKCPQIEIIEACGISGIDFAVLDMEHTPLGPRDLYPLVLAAERRGIELMVRVPGNKEEYIKWALDLGVTHIQVPQVCSEKDAVKAIRESFFHPIGMRGLCRFVRSSDFSEKSKNQYIEDSNSKTLITLQIEGVEGIQNLDSIISVNGVQSILIGPYDLSQSLGKPGEIWDEEVVKEMNKIILKCKEKEVLVGTFTDTLEGITFWKDRGVDFVQYASDMNIFIEALKRINPDGDLA